MKSVTSLQTLMEYDEHLHAPKSGHLDEMDKFLERHKRLMAIGEEEKINSNISIKAFDYFTENFYQIFRGK